MTTGILHEQNLEKQIDRQMGCMTGFLHLFDRNQIINGKRLYTSKHSLVPYSGMDCSSQSESSVGSPAFSGELRQTHQKKQSQVARSSLDYARDSRYSPSKPHPPEPETPARVSLPLPVFEFKEGLRSSWKFKEAPRLSLDSRATVDGKGSFYPKEIRTNVSSSIKEDESDKQRRSPSVIARLMGLDALPDSGREPMKKVELRRSASESRVSRDLRFDNNGNNFRYQPTNVKKDNNVVLPNYFEPQKCHQNGGSAPTPWKSQQRTPKSYFDSQDFYPDPKHTGCLYGEIEKRLKLRGIDEPAKDLETLKQILEALQIKGLLHSNKAEERIGSRNLVFDRRFSGEESPIVIMKPTNNRIGTQSQSANNLKSKQGVRQNLNFSGECSPPVRRDRDVRNSKFTKQTQCSEKSPRRRVEPQRRGNDRVVEQKRNSPRNPVKKLGSDQTTNRSPRNKKLTNEPSQRIYYEPSNMSESSTSSSSQLDFQRSKMEDYRQGRSLLERCDKLLNSIAEITTPTTTELSPVSVLDFYKDESSPSPVMKRCITFKDQSVDLEDESGSPVISPVRLKSDDSDFVYVSEILRASNSLSDDTDVYWLLEKQQYGANSSDSSRLHRKLIFHIITEILDRKTQLPPWKTFSTTKCTPGPSYLQQIWSEFQRIRERDQSEDLFEIICGSLKKDMAGDSINGWGETPLETSEAVLDIERLIFKDLVVETMQDLATFSSRNRVPLLRRKLVF